MDNDTASRQTAAYVADANRLAVADVTMRYNFRSYSAFYRFMALRAHKAMWLLIVGIPALCILLTIFGTNLLLIALIMLIYAGFLVMRLMRPKRAWKSFSSRMPDTLRFIFFPDQLHIVNTRNGLVNDNWMPYDEIGTPFETKSAFYLQRTDKKTYILPKSCMDQEDIDALRGFFGERFGKRFKRASR